MFDGEVMSDDFQTLMREIHRKGGAKTKDAKLNLFDCMPLDALHGRRESRRHHREKEMVGRSTQFGPNINLVEYVKMNLSEPMDRSSSQTITSSA